MKIVLSVIDSREKGRGRSSHTRIHFLGRRVARGGHATPRDMFQRSRAFSFMGAILAAVSLIPPWYSGCETHLSYGQKQCQTAGPTRWTSDWASPSLTLFLLPTFAHAGWSILVTLYVNGCVASRGADALSTRAVTALGRVAGLACVACSIWAAHAIWTRGMKTAQRDVAIPLTLSSPHAGWYIAVLSVKMTASGGVFAVLFGRGNVLGPTRGQLRAGEMDAATLESITPAMRYVLYTGPHATASAW
jgi:hypothetical protein